MTYGKTGRIMETDTFYPEDILIEKMQDGEYGWLDYVNHYSREWQEEYADFCRKNNLETGEDSAERFVCYKDAQMEEALENGDA
jgi:hypothetical protein